MIKNFLYSLFLHFLLLLLIYYNFDQKNIVQVPESEVAISVTALNDKSEVRLPSEMKTNSQDNSGDKTEITREIKSEEKSLPDKVTKYPQKTVKPSAKITEIVKKPKSEKAANIKQKEKIPKEKKAEEKKAEEKKPEKVKKIDKIKEEPATDKREDKTEDKTLKKEKNPASQEKFEPESKNYQDADEIINNLENLGLSAREKFNIRSQLRRCYHKVISKKNGKDNSENKIKVLVTVKISKDGYINSNLDEIIDAGLYDDETKPDYKTNIENIRRAINLCSPLRNLPIDKYDIWKEVVLEFNSEDKL
jgi:outer membrane biosynthesis protein TonB